MHLNPLAVTFSLMIWGFLWDAPGLLLAIPMTAAFKAVLGSCTLDTTGTKLTIKDNAITDAQLQTAVTTLFGKNATLTSTG